MQTSSAFFNPTLTTKLHVKAAKNGIKATLIQIKNKIKRVIAYYSQTLSAAKQNYNIPKKISLYSASNNLHSSIFS